MSDLIVESRKILPPSSVSAEARDYLARGSNPSGPALEPDDVEGWRRAVAELEGAMQTAIQGWIDKSAAQVERKDLGGSPVYHARPEQVAPWAEGRVLLHLHGGGWAYFGGEACGGFAAIEAHRLRCETIAVDYRRPPDHRFPAALDDCVAVYRELIETYDPADVIVSGLSAGGNLAAAMTLRVRDEGMGMPAAVVLLSPLTDGALLSDTLYTHDQLDAVISRETAAQCWAVYANNHDRTDPCLSPVYADFSKGFPPTLIQSGARDLFLSDSVRLHRALRAAKVHAELHVWEAMPHGGFGGAPEDDDVTSELQAFLEKIWGAGR